MRFATLALFLCFVARTFDVRYEYIFESSSSSSCNSNIFHHPPTFHQKWASKRIFNEYGNSTFNDREMQMHILRIRNQLSEKFRKDQNRIDLRVNLLAILNYSELF